MWCVYKIPNIPTAKKIGKTKLKENTKKIKTIRDAEFNFPTKIKENKR
jgi:hypothetical protein